MGQHIFLIKNYFYTLLRHSLMRVPPPLTVEEEFLLLLNKIWME